MSARLPALFVGHGSPMNALSDNSYTRALARMAAELPRPRAVAVVSAHWITPGTRITASANPGQLYDFFGFPEELNTLKYPMRGDPVLAEKIAKALSANGAAGVSMDPDRGIDHAGWAVLIHMFKAESVPIMQISLDYKAGAEAFFGLGAALAPLRDEGILVMGSGNIVHNLAEFEHDIDAPVYGWARGFDAQFVTAVQAGDRQKLADFAYPLPESRRSIPTPEHYLPALAVLGAATEGDRVRYFHEGFQNASVSMRCFAVES